MSLFILGSLTIQDIVENKNDIENDFYEIEEERNEFEPEFVEIRQGILISCILIYPLAVLVAYILFSFKAPKSTSGQQAL